MAIGGVFAGCGEKETKTDTGEQCYKTAQHVKILHRPIFQVKQADYREQDLHGGLPGFQPNRLLEISWKMTMQGIKERSRCSGSEDLDRASRLRPCLVLRRYRLRRSGIHSKKRPR